MADERGIGAEPLAALAQVRELHVPGVLHDPVTRLEREQLLMPDRSQSPTRLRRRADLDPALPPQVVDDVDARARQVGVRNVADESAAHRTRTDADARGTRHRLTHAAEHARRHDENRTADIRHRRTGCSPSSTAVS